MSIITTDQKRTLLHFEKIRGNFPKISNSVAMDIAKAVERTAKEIIISETKYGGHGIDKLAESFNIEQASTESGAKAIIVSNDAKHARMVDRGTRPHIQPRSMIKKFREEGHPGAAPMHFMSRATNRVNSRVKEIANKKVRMKLRGK
jgi:hypothetical protein